MVSTACAGTKNVTIRGRELARGHGDHGGPRVSVPPGAAVRSKRQMSDSNVDRPISFQLHPVRLHLERLGDRPRDSNWTSGGAAAGAGPVLLDAAELVGVAASNGTSEVMSLLGRDGASRQEPRDHRRATRGHRGRLRVQSACLA
jgi:hypothetical protein